MARVAYTERFVRHGASISEDPRITRNKLVSLRARQTSEDTGSFKAVAGLLNEVQSFLNGLLHVMPNKPHTMCKYYGHVIKGKWSGERPHCADCGAKINSVNELRSSSPRA